jgi:hypothetical protein
VCVTGWPLTVSARLQEDPRTEASAWEELLLQRKIPNKHGGKVRLHTLTHTPSL